ncbi:MAG: hypothetical protein ACQETO_12520 [Pseudomonadota bacterium]
MPIRHTSIAVRPLTGNRLVAALLVVLMAMQAAVAAPPSHHGQTMMHDDPHAAHAGMEADHTQTHEDCCEVECRDCTMGGCFSMTQNGGPGPYSADALRQTRGLDDFIPDPLISGPYRPPILR